MRIQWFIPEYYKTAFEFDKYKVYRSRCENYNYKQIDFINSQDPTGIWITTYQDPKPDPAERFYLVSLFNSQTGKETLQIITFTMPTFREQRIIMQTKWALPPIIQNILPEQAYMSGIKAGLTFFNIVPPVTEFTTETFPYEYEALWITGSEIGTVLTSYLPIGIRDFDYSVPGGITLRVDRAGKIETFVDRVMKIYIDLIRPFKFDLVEGPHGLGTFILPVSLGARL